MRSKITVICPAFNEEDALPIFFQRTSSVAAVIANRYDVDILFINNASTDRTLDLIRSFSDSHVGVYVATLSKNVGYQRAVECGLRVAKGNLLVVIDADCEDPPEMIVDLLDKQEQGHDVVYGERVDRTEGSLMKALRRLFYRVTRAVADEEIVLDMAEFALLTAEVRDAIIADTNTFPFIRSSIGRVGFRRIGIPYKRQARVAGETHYNLFRMIIFAVAGILSSSTLLLRLPTYLFPFWLIAIGVLTAIYLYFGSLWSLLAAVVLACAYLGGTAAFIAVYVARIYNNTLGRPNYVINRKLSSLQP